MRVNVSDFIVLIVVGCAAYTFASNLTGFKIKDVLVDSIQTALTQGIKYSIRKEKANRAKFDLMDEKRKAKSKKYRYYHFLNELLLDIGWRKRGVTAEAFTLANATVSLAAALMLLTVISFIPLLIYVAVVIFLVNIAIMFAVSRYGARQRIRKLINAENLICGNISRKTVDAIQMNMDLFDKDLRPAFTNFIDRFTLQNISLERCLAMLNAELGEHSTPLCARLLIYETIARPGMEDLFQFVMENNIREETRAAKRDVVFGEINALFFQCTLILLLFLTMCLLGMPEVLAAYQTNVGRMVLAVFFSLIAIAFVYLQSLQSKGFKFKPKSL